MYTQDNEDKTAQEKILRVTIELIDEGKGSTLTVRQIATLAGVNVGAINYYFGSKDELINIASRRILQRVNESFLLLDDTSLPPLVRLENFFIDFIGKMLHCHKSFVHQVFKNENGSNKRVFSGKREIASYIMESGFDKIKATIIELTGDSDDSRTQMLSLQVFSAIIMPNIMMSHAQMSTEKKLPPIEEQVSSILNRMFR